MKKRIFSILMVLVFSIVLIACKKKPSGEEPPVVEDKIAPLLEIVPKVVNLEYNQDYDLMTGVTARDNIDGTITDRIVITSDGGFKKNQEGTYTITYSVSDKAGNKTTGTRTITVAEMRTTIEINGAQYHMEYNPQLREYNGESFPFNLEVVTVFEKAYVDWLIAHNDQRFGAYWSVVAILDADRKVVEYRDFNTNQVNSEGSSVGTTWCTGTPTAANKAYENRFGMLANMNVPVGGYVVVFINDGANLEDSPRTFGSKQIVEKAFDAIGLVVNFHNIPEGATFNPNKTYPVIRLEEEPLDRRALPDIRLDQGTKITNVFGNDLLEGVSVYHDRETLTAEVYEIYKIVDGEKTVITAADIDENDLTAIYGIKYKATDALGNVGTETRRIRYIEVEEPEPEVTYVKIGEATYLAVLDGYDWTEASGVGSVTTHALIFTKEYLGALPGYTDPIPAYEGRNYTIKNSILAITDANGKVVQIRIHPGHIITWDSENNQYVVDNSSTTAMTQQHGLYAAIPDGGYVFLFQNSGAPGNAIRAWGCQQLTGYADVGGTGYANEETGGVNHMTVNPFAEGFKIEIVNEVVEPAYALYIKIGNEDYIAELDNYDWTEASGVGSVTTHALVFSRDYLAALPGYSEAIPAAEGRNYVIQYSILAITNKYGRVVQVRTHPGHKLTWSETENKIVVDTSLTATTLHHGLLADIPEGGYVFLFQNIGGDNSIRKWGCQQLTGFADVGAYANAETGGVANMTVNPFAEGFVIQLKKVFETEKLHVTIGGAGSFEVVQGYSFAENIGINNKVYQFTKEQWQVISTVVDAPDYPKTGKYHMANLSLVVTDANGKVVAIRLYQQWTPNQAGIQITVDSEGNLVGNTVDAFGRNNVEIGVMALIPDGGFVYVFATGTPTTDDGFSDAMKFGYRYLFGLQPSLFNTVLSLDGEPWPMDAQPPINPFAEGFKITVGNEKHELQFELEPPTEPEEPEVPETLYVTINKTASFEVIQGYDFEENIGVNNKIYQFTKEQWQEISTVVDAEGYTNEGKYKMANLALAVTDADGNIVAIRLYQKWTANQAGIQLVVNNEGIVNINSTDAFNRNNFEVGVMALIPDGGFVYVFASPTPSADDTGFSDAMKFGYKYLFGLQPSLNNTVLSLDGEPWPMDTPPPVDPFAEGFKITVGKVYYREPEVVYIQISGEEYVALLDTYNWAESSGVGSVTTHALVFSKEFLAALPGYETTDTADDEGRNYTIQYSILAITDAEGNVVQVRIHPGHKLTWSSTENKIVAEKTLTATTLQHGLLDDIPDGGYVYLFQNTGVAGNPIRAWGCQKLTGFADVGGTGYANAETGGVANMTVNPFAEEFKVQFRRETEPELMYVVIGDEKYLIELDTYEWDADGGVGAITSNALAFSKDFLAALPGYSTYEVTTDDEGKNYTIQYSILAIIDAEGNVVQIRIHPGHKITWDAEANQYVVSKTLEANKMQYGILDDIPDGGFVVLFQNSGAPGNAIRAWGCQKLTGFADVGGTGYANAETGGVANMTVNPFINGFKVLLKKESELKSYVKIGGKTHIVELDTYEWDLGGGVGAVDTHAVAFSKDFLAALPGYATIDTADDEGRNYTIQYSILAITDADGKVVQIRIHPGHKLTWSSTENKIVADKTLTATTLQHGLLDDIPDGGYVFLFQNTNLAGNPIRAWGCQQLTGFQDVGGTGYANAETGGVANMTVNPFAEGFIIEIIEK